MHAIVKNAGRKMGKAVLAFFAFMLVIAVIVQISLVVVVNIAATGGGTKFLNDKINEALQQSGYNVSFQKVFYDPIRGITVRDVSISDTSGPFLSLDRFSLSASLLPLSLRDLQLAARGGTLVLTRLPFSAEEPKSVEEATENSFSMPDLYIKKASLSLSFEKILLGEDVSGTPISFSPALQARVTLSQSISLWLDLKPGLDEIAPGVSGPEYVLVEGDFVPSDALLNLKNFEISQKEYSIQASGTGKFSQSGQIDFSVNARHQNLSSLTGNAIKSFDAAVKINGPYQGPAIDLSGKVIPLSLKEKGLGDIDLSISMEDITKGMAGLAKISTNFYEESITLESDLSYDAPLLTFHTIKGNAPKLSSSGNGVFSSQTTLFDGSMKLSASDLSHYRDLLDIDLGGAVDAEAILKSNGSAQSLQAKAVVRNGCYDTVSVKTLNAEASFASLSAPWPQSGNVRAKDLRIGSEATFTSLSADLTQTEPEQYELVFKGNGAVPMAVSFDGKTRLSNLTQAIPTARDINLAARLGKSSANLSGDFSPNALNLTLVTNDFHGADIPAELPDALSNMRLTAKATMTGTPEKPQTDIDASITGFDTGAYRNAALQANIQHNGENVVANLSGKGAGIRNLKADTRFPMTLSLLPFQWGLEKNAALSGNINADVDLAVISPLFIPPTQTLSGRILMDGTIGGTLSAPAPVASLKLQEAAFDDEANGINIADLSATASVTKDGLTLNRLHATDGAQGTLSGSGGVSFDPSKNSRISLQMKDFNVPHTNMANGIVNADLSMAGSTSGLDFSGKIDVSKMDILIPETFQSRIPELNIIERREDKKAPFAENINLAVQINAPNQVFVRGWGLDAEFGGTIDISGNASAPQFDGTLSSKRGRYEEFGKRFSLEQADLRFQGEIPPSPYLDIKATTPADDVTAAILLTGSAKSPSIEFSSTPALPRDEVLSRILFGKESSKISPFQAVQLAQTIQRFSGKGGGFDPLALLRSTTGLDDISIETDESGETNVGVGKYLTDRVYFELEKGKAENSGAAVIQLEVTPSINVESRVGQDAQTGGGVLWKHDY